jgi:hypothetical protein
VVFATRTATRRATNSAASIGSRSLKPSAKRYSIARFCPSIKPEPLAHGRQSCGLGISGLTAEDANHRHRLLRTRRQRPRGDSAADERDELATFHSITSSARASRLGGTARPSILALWRLMTSSNFVACMTGRSAGFAPLRTRPV